MKNNMKVIQNPTTQGPRSTIRNKKSLNFWEIVPLTDPERVPPQRGTYKQWIHNTRGK